MNGFTVFFGKELREYVRKNRLLLLLGVFLLFGILNPATAKLTPKLLEIMADDLAAQGMNVTVVQVTALDAWMQFAKNLPAALIVLLIVLSGVYTSEYQKGTLIPLLTKGLSRSAVVLSKCAVMLLTWSACVWLCFGVTYFYSDFYWDNSVVQHPAFACFGWWLFGVLMLCCIVFFSALADSAAQVMLGTGAVYFVLTLLGFWSRAKQYLPTRLTDSASLYAGTLKPSDYLSAACITAALSAVLVLAALLLTRRRRL